MFDLHLLRCRPRLFCRIGRAWLLVFAVSLLLIQPAAANPRYAALVIDAKTGETLFARYADEPRYPASLTKMMTLYLLFEELEAGRLTLDSKLKVSAYAASRPPTKLGLAAGATIRAEDAIRAMAVRSSNDIAVVVAENLEGSVSAFAERMTRTARAIGMRQTTFRNPSGLPNSEQKTTAHDMALLARALIDRFPRYSGYFSLRSFTYGGRRYNSTNRLLGKVRGMNGMKTGYTRASGFNLVTRVERDGREIIAVVMGGRTAATRNNHMVEIINAHISKASRGPRTAPLISVDLMTPAPTPRSRPGQRDTAAAAVAELVRVPAKDGPRTTESVPQPLLAAYAAFPMPRPMAEGDTDESREPDPIATRIASANEVAELAYAAQALTDGDKLARLTELAGTGAPSKAAAVSEPATEPEGAAEAGAEAQENLEAAPQAEADTEAEPEPLPGGWHVQIAAVPEESGARALLEQAQKRAGNLLGEASPHTQRIETNGTVLYRARFAGFAGKDEARDICAKLKRQSIDCLALPN